MPVAPIASTIGEGRTFIRFASPSQPWQAWRARRQCGSISKEQHGCLLWTVVRALRCPFSSTSPPAVSPLTPLCPTDVVDILLFAGGFWEHGLSPGRRSHDYARLLASLSGTCAPPPPNKKERLLREAPESDNPRFTTGVEKACE